MARRFQIIRDSSRVRSCMKIPGRRIQRNRWVHTSDYVVAVPVVPVVPVEAVIPDADPSEACYEPDTVEFLREVEARARRGDVEWLKRHGRVYQALDTA